MTDIAEVFGLMARRFGSLLAIALPFAAIIMLIALWPDLDPESFDAVTSAWGRLMAFAIIPGLAYYLTVLMPWWVGLISAGGFFAVAWHRRLLADAAPFPRSYIVASVLYALVVTVFLVAALFALVFWFDAIATLLRSAGRSAAMMAIVLGIGALILLAGRLLPRLTAIAMGDRATGLSAALRMTRGESWRIGLGLLVVLLPTFALVIASVALNDLADRAGVTLARAFIGLFGTASIATYATILYGRATGQPLTRA